MAQTKVLNEQRFPAGTSVSAYDRGSADFPPNSGAPPGTAVATATVAADESLTFTGLADNKMFWAYANVGGVDVYVDFDTRLNPSQSPSITPADISALSTPNAQTGAYVQADATSVRTGVLGANTAITNLAASQAQILSALRQAGLVQ